MINRELGLLEIKERLKENYVAIGLTTFRRNPTEALREEQFPYVIMEEGVDQIIERSGRNKTGYPAKRVLEVILEIGTLNTTNIRDLYNKVRTVIFTERGTDPPVFTPIVAQNVFINENRTEGPTGVDIPGILVMRLVLDLVYTDNGF